MEPTQMPVSTPPVAPMAPAEEPKKKTPIGIVIALLVVVLALVAGAFFLLKERMTHTNGTDMSDVSSLQEQSVSTEPAAIQADLTAQSPDSFNQDLDAAFNELDASLQAN